MELNKIYNMDCLKGLAQLPDKSIDLVLADPPYNIGKSGWDKIDGYINWCMQWIKECGRVLSDTGSLYIWHNDMEQVPELMEAVRGLGVFDFRQFNIWVKPNFRRFAWRRPTEKNQLRNWFNICEYCLYYVKAAGGAAPTGLDRVNSSPECYKPIKDWYKAEKGRLCLTDADIAAKYTEATGRRPNMVRRHYFRDSQFEIPTRQVWESVYAPLGFGQSYEGLRQSYEGLRQSYEGLRPVHRLDQNHCNVWVSSQITGSESASKNHICEKPVDILRRIIATSTKDGGTVLDPFMGSGSTAVACLETGRKFIGFETSAESCGVARGRTEKYD